MSKVTLIGVLVSLVLAQSSCKNGSCLEERDGFTIVHLEGSAYERGAAYGLLMRREAREFIARWKNELELTFGCDFKTVMDEFYGSTSYLESIKESDPDLLVEVYGMSESSGIDYSTLLAFQMSEELFTVLDKGPLSNCTGIGRARTDSTATLLAQNMDPPAFLHGHPLVLHVSPGNGDPERYIFSVPGLLGLAGMNARGVAVTCMGMSMLNHANTGLPVVSVVRNILSKSTLEEAEEFLKNATLAIPQCYGVGGPGGVACYECSANRVVAFHPFEDPEVFLHTNFSAVNRDFNAGYIALLARYDKTIEDPYFCPRYFLAYDKVKEFQMCLSPENAMAILRLDEPETEPILNQNTLGTLVMELDPDPVLYLATGHQGANQFHRLSFH